MTDSTYQVYTLLSPTDVARLGGIPPQAIVGLVAPDALRTGHFTPETFTPNSIFREFMHDVLGRCGLASSGLRDEGRRIGDGYVYLIDGRTPSPQGRVPPEDIIGAFEVKAGVLVPGSYQANPNHRLVTDHGLFQLPAELQQCLIDAMRNLPPVENTPR